MESPQNNNTMPLRDGFNFTPLRDGERIRMRVSENELARMRRGPGYRGTVLDIDTGQQYRVYGAPCDLPHCYCDAAIEPILPNDSPGEIADAFIEAGDIGAAWGEQEAGLMIDQDRSAEWADGQYCGKLPGADVWLPLLDDDNETARNLGYALRDAIKLTLDRAARRAYDATLETAHEGAGR